MVEIMIIPEKMYIRDFLIVKKTGSWLFYQQVGSDEDELHKNEIQLLDGFCNAIKQFAAFFSDSFSELDLKNSKIMIVPGKKVDCYVRMPNTQSQNKQLITSTFKNIIVHFEKLYSDLLDMKKNDPELFDGFSTIIKDKIIREIPVTSSKSSDVIKKFLGIDLSVDQARKIISQL